MAGRAGRRRLREQLRRARAKGLSTRLVEADALRAGTALRREVDALAAGWLRARRMEPMGFLVAVEPFHAPEAHRYVVAERGGRAVGFLSAVPVPAARGWLVEDLVRSAEAPNGTAESLLAALCRDVSGAAFVTLGLAPLAGRRARWAGLAAAVGRPLYDFAGLRAFKARLHPARWQPVYLLHRERTALGPVLDALRAFAGGSLLRFGARSLVAHPVGPPWALSIALAIWTVVLAVLAAADHAAIFGYDRATLAGWVLFDALLAILLFRFALRPRVAGLVVATALAGADAALSLVHLARPGLPAVSWHLALRFVATVGPLAGALALGWAAMLRVALARRRPAPA
jgi:hypothetical protein